MAAGRNLNGDEIKWVLSVDAQGAQAEIQNFASEIDRLKRENEALTETNKETIKSTKEMEKAMAQLAKQGQQNTTEYQNLSKRIADNKTEIDKNTKAITGNNKTITDQNKKIQEVIKTMKIEDMTMSQLRKRAAELQKQLENTSKSLSPESYAKLEKQLGAVRGRMDQLRQSTTELNKEAAKTPSILQGGLMVLAGNLMTKAINGLKQLVGIAKEWIAEGIRMAATAEGITTAFNKLNQPELLKNLRNDTKGILSDVQLMKAAIRAESFKLPLDQLGSLLKFAQQRAQETGESVDDLTEKIVEGIGKQSMKTIVNLGISVDTLKDEIKKTGDFTTAAINVVNRELEKQGDLVLTSADKAVLAAGKWQNAQMAIGQQLLGLRNIFSGLSAMVADWFSEMIGKHLPGFLKWLEDITNALIDIYNSSIRVRAAVAAWVMTWRTAGTAALAVIKSIGDNLILLLELAKSFLTFDFKSGIAAWAKFGDGITSNFKGAMESMKEIANDGINAIGKKLEKVDFTSMPGAGAGGRGGGFAGADSPTGGGGGNAKKAAANKAAAAAANKALQDEMQQRLKIIDAALEKEINLLKKQRMEGLLTEQDYNDKVEQITIEALNRKMEIKGQEEQAYIRYESQILDAQIRRQETADKLLLQELNRAKDEKINILEASRNAQLEYLKDSETDQKIYALRAQEIETNTAAARKAIMDEFGKAIEQAEFNNILNRRKAIEDNAKTIIAAEKNALQDQEKLRRLFAKNMADFDQQYNIRNWEQRKQDELRILQRQYDEKLIMAETYQKAIQTIEKKYRDELLKARQEAELTTMKESFDIELENLSFLHQQKMLSEEEYEQAVFRMRMKYASRYAEQYADYISQTADIVANLMQAETTNIEARYDAEIAAAAGNKEEVERLEREKAQKKLEVEKKYADVQFAITAAQIIANTAMAVMQAFAQLGPIAGAIAGAIVGVAGVAQLLVANAQRKKVKAMTLAGADASEAPPSGKVTMRTGLAEGGHNTDYTPGGYTTPGPKYSQAGWLPVHSGEYVVASNELARPDVADKVRYIENIRRSRITGKRSQTGLAEGGHNEQQTTATIAAEKKTVDQLAKIVQRLADGDIVVNYGITEMEAAQRRKQDVESIFTK